MIKKELRELIKQKLMGKLNRWTYFASKFVECLDRNKRFKMKGRKKLKIAQKRTKMKEKNHKGKHEKVRRIHTES
jgi:hypothetical protein